MSETSPQEMATALRESTTFFHGLPPSVLGEMQEAATMLESLASRLGELQDQLRQRDEIIDTEHQQTERQKQRAIDAECRLNKIHSLLTKAHEPMPAEMGMGVVVATLEQVIELAKTSGTAPARHADGSAEAAPYTHYLCPRCGAKPGERCRCASVVERRNGFD
jgi:hypothetical protein